MLNIISHQGSANQNHNEIPLIKMVIKMVIKITLIKMVIIKKKNKTEKNTCCQGRGEIGTLVHCFWECQMVELLWKTV